LASFHLDIPGDILLKNLPAGKRRKRLRTAKKLEQQETEETEMFSSS